ncbi:strictosidine synthase, partial [Mycobacterium sp. ITM-2017-0098]
GEAVAGVRMTHPEFSMVTGIVEAGGRLWLGTIGAPYLGWIAL